jgi:uncharacterized protein (DUF1501 family)
MHSKPDTSASRRAFLKRASTLSVAGIAAPWALNLAAMAEASAATAGDAGDYKALVCVFLYGGNDYANTLAPYDSAGYAVYPRSTSRCARRLHTAARAWPPPR